MSEQVLKGATEAGNGTPQWLTVAQASHLLGVSEKTVRKRIASGAIAAERATLAAGGWAWHVDAQRLEVLAAPGTPGSATEGERLEPSNRFQPHDGSMAERLEGVTEAVGSVTEDEGPKVPTASNRVTEPVTELLGAALPTVSTALPSGVPLPEVELLRDSLAREREQNAFLRGVVEQQQRDAAELRAALRQALTMSTRALPESTSTAPAAPPERVPVVPLSEATEEGLLMVDAAPTGPELGKVRESKAAWDRSKGLRGWLLRILRG